MADVTANDLAKALTQFRADLTPDGYIADPGMTASRIYALLTSPLVSDPGAVCITVSRDNALRLEGWINAHRPPGDWEPGFLSRVLAAIDKATAEAVAGG